MPELSSLASGARVVNVKHPGATWDVYVGRGSRIAGFDWGNPFRIGDHGTRADVIAAHRAHVLERPWLVDKIRAELSGKVLGCFCKPLACHGDTLAWIAARKPVGHVLERHVDCRTTNCQVCDGGLSICRTCGAGEGGLTSECPRERYDMDEPYKGLKNFICGEWVYGSYDQEGDRNIPFWCGRIHWAD